MSKRRLVSFLAALSAFAVIARSHAAHADHDCNGAVTWIDAPAGRFYVDDRDLFASPGGIWVYQESNGVASLQSGGVDPFGTVDGCAHPNPDTLLLGY